MMVLEYVPVGKEKGMSTYLVEIGIPVIADDKEQAIELAWERYSEGSMDTLPPKVMAVKKLERVV